MIGSTLSSNMIESIIGLFYIFDDVIETSMGPLFMRYELVS